MDWRELIEPVTQKKFLFNLKTGQLWHELDDSSAGRKYYFNAQTNETVWENPRDASCATTNAVVGDPDWKEFFDETHKKHYYVNSRTNVSSWERPAEYVPPPPPPPPGEPPALPSNWKEMVDKSRNRMYYLNTATNESSWVFPGSATRAPPAAAPPPPPLVAPTPSTLDPHDAADDGHPALPDSLMSAINQFQVESFAQTHFKTHRGGLLNRKIKPTKLMQFSRTKIEKPLLKSSIPADKAVQLFSYVQIYMGDADHGQKEWVENRSLCAQAVLTLCMSNTSLRDELYSQIQKQLTHNPSPLSGHKGWELLRLCLSVFPPSKDYDFYLKNFLESCEKGDEITAKHARRCLVFLARITQSGPRAQLPMMSELQAAREHLLHSVVFNASLNDIMADQSTSHPSLALPRVFPWLIDEIKNAGGLTAEGIYQRLPVTPSLIVSLKEGIVRGQYALPRDTDPHLICSVLKLWLRELSEPVVPFRFYKTIMQSNQDYHDFSQIIDQFPKVNQAVLKGLVAFWREIVANSNVNLMTAEALSAIVAPDILRSSDENQAASHAVLSETQIKRQFVWSLILNMKM